MKPRPATRPNSGITATHFVGVPGGPRASSILLVSDNPDRAYELARLICVIFSCVVVQTCFQAEAIEVAGGAKFDAIVLSGMPDGNEASFGSDLRRVTSAPILWIDTGSVENSFTLSGRKSAPDSGLAAS